MRWRRLMTVLLVTFSGGCEQERPAEVSGGTDTTGVEVESEVETELEVESAVEAEGESELGTEAESEVEAEVAAEGEGEGEAEGEGEGEVELADEGEVLDEVEVDVTPGPAALPPWLAYCSDADCDSADPVVVAVCPEAAPTCFPARTTTIVPSVDGRPINGVAFPLTLPEGTQLRLVSGSATVIANLVMAYAPRVELHTDADVRVSYYDLAPVWGGTVALDFVSTTRTSELLDSVFFRHPSYDTGTAAADLHARGQVAITDERTVTGISSEHVRAFFMPMELAAVSGEGNFSYGDGTVTSNYGNPPYIDALGGIMNVAFPRFAHECVHELFNEISANFGGSNSCLNEGLADALAFVVGHLPEADFGPVGLRGIDFDSGCTAVSEMHDVGNCYFWQVKKAGLLTRDFMHGLFHPAHAYAFDSCDQTALATGNALLVYFTEAASGADMRPVLDAIGVPHAASYEAALAALGL